MSSLTWPPSLAKVSAHNPSSIARPSIIGILNYVVIFLLYVISISKCVQTVGEPYTVALAHHSQRIEVSRVDEFEEEWAKQQESEAQKSFSVEEIDASARAAEIPLPHPYMPNFWALLFLVVVVVFHALSWFVQRWSVRVRNILQFTPASRLTRNTYAFVTPHPHQGRPEIIPVCESIVDDKPFLYFIFQRQRFEIDEKEQIIRELQTPVKLPLKDYIRSKGLSNTDSINNAEKRFGTNSLHIPLPSFKDLYVNQILGPVPVFQIFCASLWLLDQYWNYALFNLGMIFLFEATTAFARLRNLNTIRGMKNKEELVMVRRNNEWKEISSEQLLPGDLFSLRRENQDVGIPCDCLLLSGNAVVNEATLTGESIPQMKEPLVAEDDDLLDIDSTHRVHVLFSGTTLTQHSSANIAENASGRDLRVPPDGGCVCFCLRTGFSSSQGKLVRMIEWSSEQVMSDTKETIALLTLLLVFALSASGYVLNKGLQEGKRSQYELVLRCVLILTSVVPPELPMQTAVAVNTALLALWKAAIFCTEPFRIPYAGKVGVALFDKTGTLTTDQLVAVGAVSYLGKTSSKASHEPLKPMSETSQEVALVLASCHSLVEVNEKLVGDPIEVAALEAIPWTYLSKDQKCFNVPPLKRNEQKGDQPKLDTSKADIIAEVISRYHFVSRLQRMSVIAKVSRKGLKSVEVLVKGSPESILKLLVSEPPLFESTYKKLAQDGLRVLALASRRLDEKEASEAVKAASHGHSLPREDVEQKLNFVGFVAFSCLVRKDTALAVRELQEGSIKIIMVTGDAALTALHVASQVGITKLHSQKRQSAQCKALILQEGKSRLRWVPAFDYDHANQDIPYEVKNVKDLSKVYDLCITGSALQAAVDLDSSTWSIVQYVSVFARMAPHDKERVLRALKDDDFYTMMCGDGANDVGALKQAHVGLALLSGFGGANTAKEGERPLEEESPEERKAREQAEQQKLKEKQGKAVQDRQKLQKELQELQMQYYQEELKKLTDRGESFAPFKAMKNALARGMEEQKKRVNEQQKKYAIAGNNNALAAQAAMLAADMDTGEVPMVKLGDASIAAPFTSKLPSIRSTVDIIRQGRCTLVSTIQMQQILALNCLIAAYSLSALYLDGVRSGEAQMIASGILLTIASLSFSYAQPLKELSPVRPITSIFHPAIWLSIVGQLAIHLGCMVYSINMVKSVAPEELEALVAIPIAVTLPPPVEATSDGEPVVAPFKPTLLNTIVWLVETAQQVSVMAVNYKGRPFMIASTENRPMLYSLSICCMGIFVCAFEVIPELNNLLQLFPFPSDEFRNKILITLGLSVFGAFLWDRLMMFMFARDILVIGTRDAWNNLPSFRENLTFLGKIAGIAGLIAFCSYTQTPPLLLLGGWWFLRKRMGGQQAPASGR